MFPEIIGLMAATEDGIVGKKNGLPWHYRDELDHFRKLTKGQVVVLGRKTYEHVPAEFFTDRTIIVFSRTNQKPPVKTAHGLNDFLSLIKPHSQRKIFMAGGAELAHFFFKENLMSEFILTKIRKFYQGDTRLDLNWLEGWLEASIITSNTDFSIIRLLNPKTRTAFAHAS